MLERHLVILGVLYVASFGRLMYSRGFLAQPGESMYPGISTYLGIRTKS